MASKQATVDYLLDQMSAAGKVTAKKMFGEYGLYLQEKMFALVCDDRLFFKVTEAGQQLIEKVKLAPPYPGAKPCLLIAEEQWDYSDYLVALVKATAKALPLPVKKPKKT